MRPPDVIQSVIRSWERKEYFQALLHAWGLNGFPYSAIRKLELHLTLRNLVFQACHFAVTQLGGMRGQKEEATTHLNELLSRPVPSCLVDHETVELNEAWCQSYRRRMVLAHLLCARAVVESMPADGVPSDGAFQTINSELSIHGAAPLTLAFLGDLCRQLFTGPRPHKAVREVWFPLARSDGGRESAEIAKFMLEPLAGEEGAVFIAVEQAFVPVDADFEQVFCHAPQLLAAQGICSPLSNVCVRIERAINPGLIDTPLLGSSCGGALALGLRSLWTGEPLKDDLVISFALTGSADLEPDGRCYPICFDAPKLRAVAHLARSTGRRIAFLVAEDQRLVGQTLNVDVVTSATLQDALTEAATTDNSGDTRGPAAVRCKTQAPRMSAQLQSQIEEARRATRKHDHDAAAQLWGEARKLAEGERNKPAEIRARLELCLVHLRDGRDVDEILPELNQCIREAKDPACGTQRPRLLHLLGEAHRLKGDPDQARGFFLSSLELARASAQKPDEGWALLSLSTLGQDTKARLELIQNAYDCFSAAYASGDQEQQHTAQHGSAFCHSLRAEVFGHRRIDDAMAEYARAIAGFRQLGREYEWNQANALFERGDLHARADDPELAAKDLFAAAELFKALDDPFMEAKSIMGLAELLDKCGQLTESQPYYEAAAAAVGRLKNQRNSAWIWFRYGLKLITLRDFEQGKAILASLVSKDWLGPSQRLDVFKQLCLVAKVTGNQEELECHSSAALDVIDKQIAVATDAEQRRRLIISKGHCFEELGDPDRAEVCFRRAIHAFESIEDRHGQIECWFNIAQLLAKKKQRKEEREGYEKVLSLIGDDRSSIHRGMALTMLAQLDIAEEQFEHARECLDLAEQANEPFNPMIPFIVQDLRSKLPAT